MSLESWLEAVLDAERMRETDRWAIEAQGIPSLELMEAAGGATARAAGDVARPGPARVVCGKGNNGGDGLVAARKLAETGFEVEVLFPWSPGELSEDAEANLRRFGGASAQVEGGAFGTALEGSGVVIDAIFG